MAADLFETYAVTIIATMLLGGLMVAEAGANAVLYPLVLGGASILASIIGALFVKVKEGGSIMGALYKGVIVSAVLAAIAFYPITTQLMADNSHGALNLRSEEHTSELQSLMRISYAVFCLKKKTQ